MTQAAMGTHALEAILRQRGCEAFQPRVSEIRAWWTPDRFAIAWDWCRQRHLQMTLMEYLGTSDLAGRCVRRWQRGEVTPHPRTLLRLDELFTLLLGGDWPTRVVEYEREHTPEGRQ